MGWVLLLLAAGAAARWFDGTNGRIGGVRVPTGVRNLLMASVAFAGAWGAGGAWWFQVVAAVASLSVIIGWTDWGRWWMALRFGLPPLAVLFGLWMAGELLAVPLPGFNGGIAALYVALCAAAGGCYPLLFWLHDERRITSWRPGDGPEWWARLPLGAAVLGGVSLFSI